MLFQHTPILGQYDVKSTSTVPTLICIICLQICMCWIIWFLRRAFDLISYIFVNDF